eukprot:TRINITY_DN447_c0_g1_i1.p1 TRINITY_DN447_c0_g1~~TRINITY_DN447_c0_g1_i1.p1  ORF type:complete len:428 (+),score=98.74 TRINITY_DN447_c0_g1_i1:181-1464(+)
MAQPELTVKANFYGEIRRFRFNGLSFQMLEEELKKVFLLPTETVLLVQYRDDEGDNITMGSDRELLEAVQFATTGVLYVILEANLQAPILPPTIPSQTLPPFSSLAPVVYQSQPTTPARNYPPPLFLPQQPPKMAGPPAPVHHSRQQYKPTTTTSSSSFNAVKPQQQPQPQQPQQASHTTPPSPVASTPVKGGFASQCHQQRVRMQEWREEREKAFKQWKAHEKQVKKQEKRQAKTATKQPLLVARFVKDVTVQDGMYFPPNTPFAKTWRLRNESTIPWLDGTIELIFDGKNSDQMGGADVIPVSGTVPAGSEVDITLNLVTPSKPGRYVGFWRLRTSDGKKFGQRLWVCIHVTSPDEEAKYNEDLIRWRPSLEKLQSMGFQDVKSNLKMLNKYQGNMPKVIKKLTKKQKKAAQSPVHPLHLSPIVN